jgi:hypothetical protein
MTPDELRERILRWEGPHTDFKRQVGSNQELAKDLVCFANGRRCRLERRQRGSAPDRIAPERPPGPHFDWAVAPTLRKQLADPDPPWRARLTEITAAPQPTAASRSRSPPDENRRVCYLSDAKDGRGTPT